LISARSRRDLGDISSRSQRYLVEISDLGLRKHLGSKSRVQISETIFSAILDEILVRF
ncbi:hypothetical protein Tco_0095488, partial [Tanacetum coccineum]